MVDEGQQMVIYPDRFRLLGYALLYLVFVFVAVGFMAGPMAGLTRAVLPPYSLTHPVQAVLGACVDVFVGVLVIMMAVILLFTLYRILIRTPSMIVTKDGIIDHCSLIAGGMGLLRWQEISAIMPLRYGKGQAFLIVIPRDPRTVLARRGRLARLFLRSITLPFPNTISLPQWLLPTTVGQVWVQIRRQYSATLHAYRIRVLNDDAPEVR